MEVNRMQEEEDKKEVGGGELVKFKPQT